MRNNTQDGAKWDWLADPGAAFELHSAERRAFYNWQVADREWSEATSHMDSSDGDKMPKDRRDLIDSLKSRLDEAAEAYGQARKQLHKEWSA